MKKRLFAACLLAPAFSMAADPLPTIIVSAARTAEPGIDIPAGYRIVDRDTIVQSGAQNLPQLLRSQAGVHIADGLGDGGSASIDMRGFGIAARSNVAILINGRKLNPSTDISTLYLNAIDLDNVEQVEIIEGSAGTLYGNQAVGGMINIITRTPQGRELDVRVGAGSYNSRELMGHYSQRFNNGVGVNLQANRRVSDNYRDHNDSDMKHLSLEVDYEGEAGRSFVSVDALKDYVQTPGALFASEVSADRRQSVADYANDYIDTDSITARVGTSQSLNRDWRFEGELTYRDDERDFIQSFRGFPQSRATQQRDTWEVSPRLVGRMGNAQLTLGAELQGSDYGLQSSIGTMAIDQRLQAAYAQANLTLAEQWVATLGLRHARVQNDIVNSTFFGSTKDALDDDVTVGSVGLVYRPDPVWRLYARADQNYRFAKVDEHTGVVFGQPVGLDNQTGVSYESGADFVDAGRQLHVRLYRLNLKNEISYDATTFGNVNLDRSRRYGGSISAEWALNRKSGIGASYEYINAEITRGPHAGSVVPLVPKQRVTFFLQHRPWANVTIRADVEYVDDQYLGADYTNTAEKLDAYTVLNLTATYDIADWHFGLRINNLSNERYSETGASGFAGAGFNPAPERNAWLSATYYFAD